MKSINPLSLIGDIGGSATGRSWQVVALARLVERGLRIRIVAGSFEKALI